MPYDISPKIGQKRFLHRRGTLVLDHAKGTTIALERGSLWVTLESDPRDIVLTDGMRFEIDRGGRTVLLERFGSWVLRKAAAWVRSWSRLPRPKNVPYY
jgi:hypothetical protein